MREYLSSAVFRFVHGNHLVYNTCWEDPRIDREALDLDGESMLVITSAGCNVLDYLLAGAGHVYAVDMNPRQNALLELKLAGIKELSFETFFDMFGRGVLPNFDSTYRRSLRGHLSPYAQDYWDKHINYFAGKGWRSSFYFRGSSGFFARFINTYIDRGARIRSAINGLLNSQTPQEQHQRYDELVKEFWTPTLRWFMNRDATMALLGVPRAQRYQVENDYMGGLVKYIEDCIEAVFRHLPLSDNYFWRVYLTGGYTRDCCPEYLTEDGFDRLKDGLCEHVSVHTDSVDHFLEQNDVEIGRFVLLDHMDWLASNRHDVLEREWQGIVNRAAPRSRVLFRSGGLKVDYVDPLPVQVRGSRASVGELLDYKTELAAELHQRDRVHTYGSFYVADLMAA
ncbi:MAG: BtaA family protein [Bdellovibrionales bacterium]|nr:BtaA family protein [Bdellovibrionales bacterium]